MVAVLQRIILYICNSLIFSFSFVFHLSNQYNNFVAIAFFLCVSYENSMLVFCPIWFLSILSYYLGYNYLVWFKLLIQFLFLFILFCDNCQLSFFFCIIHKYNKSSLSDLLFCIILCLRLLSFIFKKIY